MSTHIDSVPLPSCRHSLVEDSHQPLLWAIIVGQCGCLLMWGCSGNTNEHSMPHHRQCAQYPAREGEKREKVGSTSKATTDIHFFPFHSAQLIILNAPFCEILKCHRNVSPTIPVAIPGQVLPTFYGFYLVLSAINGDLCLVGKAFLFLNLKNWGYLDLI